MRYLGIISLLAVLLLSGCRKDVNDSVSNTNTDDPVITLHYVPKVENIEGDLFGFVFDESGAPVIAADVSLNGQSAKTDDFGHFLFEDQTMNSKGQVVQITKDGFFEGSRTFFPKADSKSRVRIQLLEKAFTQSFDAEDGGTITDGNATIEFDANTIRNAAGDVYTSSVSAAVKWLDPSDPAVLNQMPGSLQGVNLLNELQALASYGMVAVELQGSAGEYLNIADGKTATLNMPVPSEMQAKAPDEIPLWSYNEEFGVWAEEGKSTLMNGIYVGEVTHFSFWNCDFPFDYVTLEMAIVDSNGSPISNADVNLTITDNIGVPFIGGSGTTNDNGYIYGIVPANEVLAMEIDVPCQNALTSLEIGPFTIDTDLGNVSVTNPLVNGTVVSGTLLDCTGMPVTNGMVISEINGDRTFYYIDDANFTIYLTACPWEEATIYGVNIDDLSQSLGAVVVANSTTNLENIIVCGDNLENAIVMTIDGVTTTYENAGLIPSGDSTGIVGDQPGLVTFKFGGFEVGDYSLDNTVGVVINASLGWSYINVGPVDNFQVFQYDTKVRGGFSGEFDDNGMTHTISCTFDVDL